MSNGGEFEAQQRVQKARRLEVEYLDKMEVVERVPYSFIKHWIGKEPIKVRWLDTLKNQWNTQEQGGEGIPPRVQNRWLHALPSDTASETGRTDDIDGGNSSMGPGCVFRTTGTLEQLRDRDDAHGHQQSVLSRSMQRREICRAAARGAERSMS